MRVKVILQYLFLIMFVTAIVHLGFEPIASVSGEETKENPFGLMLGAKGLSLSKRFSIIKDLGAVYFRPNSVFVESWNGFNEECESAEKAGLKLILTVRDNGGKMQPTFPPEDLQVYKQKVGEILDKYRPLILAVENEENSKIFYTGTPEQYNLQLKAACEVAHAKGIKCTNGGMVSSLVALLVYNNYLEIGEFSKAQSFSERAFEPRIRQKLGSAKFTEQVDKGKALLKVYKTAGIDYMNFHWYIPDQVALKEAVEYLKDQTGLPLITNEIGQQNDSPKTTRDLMAGVIELGIPYAVWFSIDAPKARALIDPDGSLRSTGEIFKSFINSGYSAELTPSSAEQIKTGQHRTQLRDRLKDRLKKAASRK